MTRNQEKLLLATVLLLLINVSAFAERNIDSLHLKGICTKDGFAIPGVQGLSLSKGVEFYQERTSPHQLSSHFVSGDSSITSELRRTKSWMAKLRIPVVNSPKWKFIVGGSYYHQEFAFEHPGELGNKFHESIQDKPIRSLGLTLYSVRSFVGKNYLVFRGALRLNGDFTQGRLAAHQKTSVTLMYGIKNHRNKSWGFGLSYSNTFGKSNVYPVLFYNNKFAPKWGLETLLPVSVRLVFRPSDNNAIYFENKLEGGNYNLNLDGFSSDPLYLEHAEFKSFITYEQRLYDFLWLGVSGGFRANMNFNVSDSDGYFDRTFPIGATDHLVIENQLNNSLFMRFGIFMIPPRKWVGKQ